MSNGIDECEAIIFDIDGVLVDVRRSYNEAIIKTVQLILKDRYEIKIANEFPFEKLISKLRNTGGFNNDIDTAYAIILIILHCILINKMDIEKTLGTFDKLVEKLDDKGKDSVEKELENMGDIRTIINDLSYPGRASVDDDEEENIISTLFNEIFYGPVLFKKQFDREPKYYFEKPLISNDKLIIKEESIKKLSQRFNGNLGLISGRSKVASYFTLGNLMKYFRQVVFTSLVGGGGVVVGVFVITFALAATISVNSFPIYSTEEYSTLLIYLIIKVFNHQEICDGVADVYGAFYS